MALAQAGQKVLVCEQHEVAGGWTHSFTLDGYRFSTGVHYIGELGEGGRLRDIYEGLGVSEDIEFLELNPDGIDHIFIGDEQFDIPKNKDRLIRRLKQRFPHEAEGIEKYFKTAAGLYEIVKRLVDYKPINSNFHLLPWLLRTGADLIERYVSDPTLRAILATQAGDHGMPLSKVSAAVHASIPMHYAGGAYYPRGGSANSRALTRALKRAGGEIRLSTPVGRILMESRRAVGVALLDGEEVRAQYILSNADPETTFIKLIGREHLPWRLKRKVERVSYSTSCLSLFLVIAMDLKAMGFDSGNYWFYEHADIESVYEQGLGDAILHQPPDVLFLTVTTLKDPSKMHSGHHTVEVFAFVSYEPFAEWAHEPTGDRSWEYQQLKEELSGRIISVLERRIPGITESVVLSELGTPLSNEHYLNSHQGNIYGIAKGVWQAGPLAFRTKPGIKNLYLCGQSTMSHGIAETANSGIIAACKILKCRKADLLAQGGPPLKIYPSDDLSQWPEPLQKSIALKRKKHG
ncbi:MAG: NAD(P)/FAD-dependent oxidoreductase [Anaerolineae bacterium]|nr:MAG: NAD(P)/FAD-dependent oxidoreductase [Anaerolineae bacterium]